MLDNSINICFFSMRKSLMNASCRCPGKCRCLRKERLFCWRRATWCETVCWLTEKQSVALIFRNVHHCQRDNALFFRWLLVMFPPPCCSRQRCCCTISPVQLAGPGNDYSAFWNSARCTSTLYPSFSITLHILKRPTVGYGVPGFAWLWPCAEIKAHSVLLNLILTLSSRSLRRTLSLTAIRHEVTTVELRQKRKAGSLDLFKEQ